MIPGPVCTHFWPALRRQCDAGLRAPHDCSGCPAYYDGTSFMGLDEGDQKRRDEWATARAESIPRAHFKGEVRSNR
jgi:hypothetical protein